MGVTKEGKRQILGVSVALSEQEVHWCTFLQSQLTRGLCGVELVISDAHTGLQAARQAVFGGVSWQRCQFHLQQNASSYVPKVDLKPQVAADLRAIFAASTLSESLSLLRRTVDKYQKSAPKLAAWMDANVPESLTVVEFPTPHRRLLRTTNGWSAVMRRSVVAHGLSGCFPTKRRVFGW